MTISVTSASDGCGNAASAWYACILLSVCFAFAQMDRSVVSLLVESIKQEFHLSDSKIGLLIGAAFALSYAVLAVPFANFSDRLNRTRIITIGVAFWCIATAGCGMATSVPMLFVARICVAAGEAVLIPAATSLISDYFSPGQRTLALSVFGMGVYFGGGIALVVGGWLFDLLQAHPLQLGANVLEPWRAVMIILGLAGLGLVPLLLLLREPVRTDVSGNVAEEMITPEQALQEVRSKKWALAATMFGFASIALANFAFHAWSPTLFVRNFGWSVGETGMRLGIFPFVLGPIGVLTGAMLATALARRGRSDHKLLVGIISACGCAVSAVALTLPSLAAALVGMSVLTLFLCFNYGVLHAALVELLPNRLRAQGVALYTVITAVFSMTIGPLAVGLLTDHFFRDPGSISLSIRAVVPTAFLLAALILILGLRPYRAAVKSSLMESLMFGPGD